MLAQMELDFRAGLESGGQQPRHSCLRFWPCDGAEELVEGRGVLCFVGQRDFIDETLRTHQRLLLESRDAPRERIDEPVQVTVR